MAKLYRRWKPTGDEFFVNERGQVCKPTTADEIVESDRARVNLTLDGQVTLLEANRSLIPLAEFDQLVRTIAALNGVTLEEASDEVNRQAANHHKWRALGMSPEAAKIASEVQVDWLKAGDQMIEALSKARR